jgi:hypothetical protein
MPMVVGIYECQDGAPSPEFLKDADAYMRTLAFGKSFLAVKPSQMRTIPVNRSVPVEHHVATYDQAREVLREAKGPFVVLPCICRKSQPVRGKPCAKVSREETCLAFGDMPPWCCAGSTAARSREEVLTILSEPGGRLVLQPANARKPEFICPAAAAAAACSRSRSACPPLGLLVEQHLAGCRPTPARSAAPASRAAR